jgi:hypothetical protein
MSIADRLAELNVRYREDEGRDLNAESVAAAAVFAAEHTEPDSVSADSGGVVYFTWRERGNLSMRFMPNGDMHWAGSVNGSRPYGSGRPDLCAWPCLVKASPPSEQP